MKKICYLSVLFLGLNACAARYVYVFETKTTNEKLKSDFYVYEDDTLKITYNFWAQKGAMTFSVYNKQNKPLYIDWKKSSYIENLVKSDYWIDEEKSNSVSYSENRYHGRIGMVASQGISAGISSKVKIERITFIPPKSIYTRSDFYILPRAFTLDKPLKNYAVQRNNKSKKTTTIGEVDFSKENTPLTFRNFLAFSFSEDSNDDFFVDNEFYLSKVIKMNLNQFQYPKSKGIIGETDGNGNFLYIQPYEKPSSFYVKYQQQ